jgi:hypothetical protein
MDILQYLFDALTPFNLVLALAGVALGTPSRCRRPRG